MTGVMTSIGTNLLATTPAMAANAQQNETVTVSTVVSHARFTRLRRSCSSFRDPEAAEALG